MNIFSFNIFNWSPKFWIANIRQFFRNIKYAWQRATKGYSDPDVWEFDNFLTHVIAGGLNELSNSTHGFPCSLLVDNTENEEEKFKRWQEILREISNDMLEYINIEDMDIPEDCTDTFNWLLNKKEEADNKYNKAMDAIKKWHRDMWD